jgi:hypothetical protein
MALPITIPYTFATAATSIPLSQLDTDFSTIYATVNGIGNGTVALSNVVITGGIISNVSGISTSAISNGTSNVSVSTANGNVTIATAGNNAVTVDTSQNMTTVGTVAMGSSFKRNRIINGNMQFWQRGTSFSANGYTTDRWAVGPAGGTVTVAQAAGPSGFGFQYAAQITGGAGVTTCPFSQKIESYNIADLASKTVTLQVVISASTSQTVLWQASYPTAIDNYTSTTSIASGSFSVTTTPTLYTVQISLPSQVTNGLQIVFAPNNGGSFTSGTITFTGVQVESGTVATPYERQIYSDQLAQCQRYYEQDSSKVWYLFMANATSGTGNKFTNINWMVSKRTAPTVTLTGAGTGTSGFSSNSPTVNGTGVYCATTSFGNDAYITAYTASAEL